MVSPTTTIISILAAIAVLAAVTTVVIVRNEAPSAPQMSEDQRATREKFFGTAKEPAPIPKGQEMRPKW